MILMINIMNNFKPNDNFFYYLYYLQERMNIFWKRCANEAPPYSEDKIFQLNKFTNAYRVLDRGSQYLLSNVIYNGGNYSDEDIVWRVFLYKNYNLPSTWEYLKRTVGDIKYNTSIEEIRDSLNICADPIFSNAYMLTCSFIRKESFFSEYGIDPTFTKKYWLYLKIFQKELKERDKIHKILGSKSFVELFDNLSDILSFADFLSYQIAQDLNYTELFNFDDSTFCAAGPGTQRGIERCFNLTGKVDYGKIVIWVYENLDKLIEEYSNKFDIDLTYAPIPGWKLRVPDLSNGFCETDKYMRAIGVKTDGIKEGRIKNKFVENKEKINYVFPPKWGINLK